MAAPVIKACRRYLLLFAHEHLDFRIAEVNAISRIFDVEFHIPENGFTEERPYLLVEAESEESVKKIMSRTMLVKSLYELWAQGSNYEELREDMTRFPSHLKAPHLSDSMCMRVETFNHTLTMPEKIEKIESILEMDSFPFKGTVNLKSPKQLFQILEYYDYQHDRSSRTLSQVYFCRWLADGQRDHIKKYNLQDRKHIGNTSMDPALAFLMANSGSVRKNDIVLDPFVGSGSIAVACAHFGAYVAGTDMDYKLLMGRGKSSRKGQKWRCQVTDNLRANLRQYGLESQYLDVLVADASLHTMWHPNVVLDAIITDPPYGVREATEKLGTSKSDAVEIPEHLKEGHIPSRIQYNIAEVFSDLLSFAAKHLRLNGRLVYWLPVYRSEYDDEQIPRHPCLQLVSNCEQVLTNRLGRRLITMEKVQEWQDGANYAKEDPNHYKDATFREMYFRPHNYKTRKNENLCPEDPEKLSNGDLTCQIVETPGQKSINEENRQPEKLLKELNLNSDNG